MPLGNKGRDHAHGDGGGLHSGQGPRLVKDFSQPCNQSIAFLHENQMSGKWLEVSGQRKRYNTGTVSEERHRDISALVYSGNRRCKVVVGPERK